ncbi:hypothetical protein HYN56_10095 [Flavobacterium crocinum]|uniref:Phospholipase D-like domain-containing protein n=1 Tax=Flavobacterium crocinum TaxID=2183896 RepID=A0A2S1YKF5_9FLAO|nr:phospholipase D family protein [Flavobacterium crocinum]AWK04561.1 hypothetical protein HYN56_10095 [Flavobacterium crocinum]
MKVTLLSQGFNPSLDKAVGNKLIEFFSTNHYQTFTGISAFASEAGVNGLSSCISSSTSFKNLNLIVGIDQQGTSKEALEEILDLKINSYIFYQSEEPIFHPKIYLFEGLEKTALIIGSSNLTARGLFNNIESSILFEFDNSDKDGENLLIDLKSYYSTLFNFTDPNLFKIAQSTIDSFVKLGVVPLKKVWLKRQGKKEANENLEKGILKIPQRAVSKLPKNFAGKKKSKKLEQNYNEEISAVDDQNISTVLIPANAFTSNFTEIWKSKPLTERDLNIPRGSNTNETGSMSLSKGLLDNIDQRHYFRDQVFNSLDWNNSTRKNSEHLEKAIAYFNIIIDEEDKGEFPLQITHNPRTDTESYIQNNSVTSLSWGKAKTLVKNRDLLGKTLTLSKDVTSKDKYTLVIK